MILTGTNRTAISLHNYRCFEHLTLDFNKGVNLLIGDNSSGKTTVIQALCTVLNSFFIGFSDENTRFIGLSKDDFRVVPSETGLTSDLPVKIDFSLLGVDASLELHSKKGRTLQKPLYPIIELAERIHKNTFDELKQINPLPLLANFSTADIHSVRKINQDKFRKYEHKPSFGYYECLRGDGFLDYWTKRMLVLREANRGELEIGCVRNALMAALGPKGCNLLSDLQIRHNQGKVYYILADNREIETDHLSDGLRRIVNIVVDLAFRSALLNKGVFGADAHLYTYGTALIDEIDLHLHPTLQSSVVKGLSSAFPNVQLLITSHAPMVMTGIDANDLNKIYKLGYSRESGYTAKEIQAYGLDASTIIESILGIPSRYKEVDKQLDALFKLIEEDDFENAAAKLKNMKEQFGDKLPELSKAAAMLDFLTSGNDKDQQGS